MQKNIKIVRKVFLIGMFCWSVGFSSIVKDLTSEPLSHDTVKLFIHNPVVKESIKEIMSNRNIQYYSIGALSLINNLLGFCRCNEEYPKNITIDGYREQPLDANLRTGLIQLTSGLAQYSNDFSQYLKDMSRAIMHGRGFDQGLVCVSVSDKELETYTDTLKSIRLYNKCSGGIIPDYIHSTEIKDKETLSTYAKKVNELMYAEPRNTPTGTPSAGDEFLILMGNNDAFKQRYIDWACNLYSYLYAVAQTKVLRDELASKIFKDEDGNYYISGIKVAKSEIDNIAEPKLHPSTFNVVKAIGIYVQKRMAQETTAFQEEPYEVVNMFWKEDFVLNRPYKRIPSWNNANAKQFLPGGILKIGEKTTYSGDFVVLLGGSPNNSYCHSRSIYYDKVKGEWCYYDNQSFGPSFIMDCNELRLQSIVDVKILGCFVEGII